MLLTTRTSVYEVRRAVRNAGSKHAVEGYIVKKIALLSGSKSSVNNGESFFGDEMIFGEHLTLFYEGEMVMKTTTIEEGF